MVAYANGSLRRFRLLDLGRHGPQHPSQGGAASRLSQPPTGLCQYPHRRARRNFSERPARAGRRGCRSHALAWRGKIERKTAKTRRRGGRTQALGFAVGEAVAALARNGPALSQHQDDAARSGVWQSARLLPHVR